MEIARFWLVLLLAGLGFSMASNAARPTYELELKNHLFHPDELVIPAGTKVRLIIRNRDDTSEEFESYELNREKIVGANHKATLFIGPLPPGIYPFFGEFNPKTAQGRIIVE